MTGHVTLPCEVYIFLFDNAWDMFSWYSGNEILTRLGQYRIARYEIADNLTTGKIKLSILVSC